MEVETTIYLDELINSEALANGRTIFRIRESYMSFETTIYLDEIINAEALAKGQSIIRIEREFTAPRPFIKIVTATAIPAGDKTTITASPNPLEEREI